MRKFGRSFKYVYLGLMLLFLYLPIIYLILFSFNRFHVDSNGDTIFKNLGKWNGFTLENYGSIFGRFRGFTWDNLTSGRLFSNKAGNSLILTLEVALVSSIAATIIGTAAAIGINVMKKRMRTVVLSVSQLPMVNPDLVTGISMMLLFAFIGISSDLGYLRLVIAHTTFNIPYVIFSVLPKLRQSSDTLYEAAMDLGCSPIQALTKVVIPDIMPGIVSGLILAFTLSIDDFAVSLFTGGATKNLSMLIFSKTAKGGVNTKFCALSALMFLVVAALLLVVNLRSMKQEKEAAEQNKKLMRKL